MTESRRHRAVAIMAMITAALLAMVSAAPPPAAAAEIRAANLPSTILLPDEGIAPIVALIATAASSIDIVSPQVTDPAIVAALRAARSRGIAVRVMLQRLPAGSSAEGAARGQVFSDAGIHTVESPPGFRASRASAIVLDRRIAAVLTSPLSTEALARGRGVALVFEDPRHAAGIMTFFDADWGRSRFLPHEPMIVTAPEQLRLRLRKLIHDAQHELLLSVEAIADQDIEQLLAHAVRRGVLVRLITSDATAAGRPGIVQIEQAGARVRVLQTPRIQGSIALADPKEKGAAALVGSFALTAPSLDDNRELAAVVQDQARIQRLAAVFDKDWAASAR